MHPASEYPKPDDTRLARLAARQHGVVALTQLRVLGYPVAPSPPASTAAGCGDRRGDIRLQAAGQRPVRVSHRHLTDNRPQLVLDLGCLLSSAR